MASTKKPSPRKGRISRHCTCENVTMSDIGRTRKRKTKTAKKTGCKVVRGPGGTKRQGCYVNGRWQFVKSTTRARI